MENLREDLGALNDTRAGPAKVSSCVRGPNFTASDSRQIIPAFGQARIWQLPQDIFFVIAAGNQHNYFRRVSKNLFRICGHAAFTSFAKCVIATGNCNLFGHPVTGGERGLQPFQHQGSWATLDVRCLLSDAIEPRAQAANQIVGFALAAGESADRTNIVEDVGNRVWFERNNFDLRVEHSRGALDSFVADCADLAKFLRQNQIRLQFAKSCFIQVVDRAMAI